MLSTYVYRRHRRLAGFRISLGLVEKVIPLHFEYPITGAQQCLHRQYQHGFAKAPSTITLGAHFRPPAQVAQITGIKGALLAGRLFGASSTTLV